MDVEGSDSNSRREEEREHVAKEENDNMEISVDGEEHREPTLDNGEWMYAKRVSAVSHEVDYRLPITSIYLKHCASAFAPYNNNYNTYNNNNYYGSYNYYQWKVSDWSDIFFVQELLL